MAVTGEALVEMEMLAHLATLTTVPATTVVFENADNSGDVPRLEVQHFPNTTLGRTFGQSKDYIGFLQITVVDQDGSGTIPTKSIAAQVAAHFDGVKLHTTDHRIEFNQPPTIRTSLIDAGLIRVPVDCPYIAVT